MLECKTETICKKILNEVKLSGMYSLILDSTTEVSKLGQFAFTLRYCTTDDQCVLIKLWILPVMVCVSTI